MKKIFLILLLSSLILLAACENPQPQQTNTSQTQTTTSECDRYTSSWNIQRCKAMAALDLSLCDPITKYATREDCILVVAELVQDQSQLSDCTLSKNKNYKIICEALIKKDATHCFTMEESLSSASDIAMRDCLELTARKLKDKTVCDYFKSHANVLKKVCGGSTSSCEGLWIYGAEENVKHCKGIIDSQT
jgi:hypothetical protein